MLSGNSGPEQGYLMLPAPHPKGRVWAETPRKGAAAPSTLASGEKEIAPGAWCDARACGARLI